MEKNESDDTDPFEGSAAYFLQTIHMFRALSFLVLNHTTSRPTRPAAARL